MTKGLRLVLNIPPTIAGRVQRAAEMRGLSVEQYAAGLLNWHSPAYDNDAQYLKAQVRGVLASEYASATEIENALRGLVE